MQAAEKIARILRWGVLSIRQRGRFGSRLCNHPQGASFRDQTKLTLWLGHSMQADQDLTSVSRGRLMLCLLASVVLGLLFVDQVRAGRLSDETSPYLKAHADDPIMWRPWGQQAF